MFTYQGQAIPAPKLTDPNDRLYLHTPVGRVTWYSGGSSYRPGYVTARTWTPGVQSITPEELERGYYDVTDEDHGAASPSPKAGTPPHWCHGASEQYDRWLDPALIGQLEW
jgi:hypothetical protein